VPTFVHLELRRGTKYEPTCSPCTARPRRAPGRLAGRGRTPREAGRAGAASLGQDAARWRARGGEAALAPRLGARAPGVVAQRRPRRTRSRRGLPGGGRGEECRPWRRARRGGGARRPLRAGRAVNGHQRQPGSLHRIRTQLFFRVRDHSGRRGAVGAKKCGNRTIASEPAALGHANRPKSVRLEGWLRG
jgi:hypothetical protein